MGLHRENPEFIRTLSQENENKQNSTIIIIIIIIIIIFNHTPLLQDLTHKFQKFLLKHVHFWFQKYVTDPQTFEMHIKKIKCAGTHLQ